ncbi:MAG: FecR domain-containing protein [Treponema sp.]|nr:FecR domain-containing protein [Candidatus Treponema equi]
MRKITAILFVAFLAAGAFALNAKVISVKGKVEVQEAGMWIPLEKGDIVEKGTVISTGFNSEAVLSVSNSNFTLGPLTRITIENLVSTGTKDNTQIYIDSGSISANVSGKDGKRAGFKVRSPVATASVRGTAFTLTSSGKLSVMEGLVAFGASESDEPSVDDSSNDVEEQANAEVAESSDSSASSGSDGESAGDQGHANAFASTSDVGGEGVPVAAGQKSKVSASTGGSPTSPRAEMAKASTGGTSNTVPASTVNSVAAGSSSAAPSTPEAPVTTPTGGLSVNVNVTGSLVVNCEFK